MPPKKKAPAAKKGAKAAAAEAADEVAAEAPAGAAADEPAAEAPATDAGAAQAPAEQPVSPAAAADAAPPPIAAAAAEADANDGAVAEAGPADADAPPAAPPAPPAPEPVPEPAQEWELFEGGTPSGWQLTPAFRLSCLPPDATVDEIREALAPYGEVGSVVLEPSAGAVVRVAPKEGAAPDSVADALRAALPASEDDAQQRGGPGAPAPTPLAALPLRTHRALVDVLGALNCHPGQNPLLFVSNVPEEADDAKLAAAFAPAGAVERAWVMHSPSGAPKKYGFVEFALPATATAVVTAPAPTALDGAQLKVEPACTRLVPQMFARTIFVDQFPRAGGVTPASLRALAARHGALREVAVPVFAAPHPQAGMPRGYSFIEFERSDDAHAARTALDGHEVLPGQKLRANFSNPTKHMAPRQPPKNAAPSAMQRGAPLPGRGGAFPPPPPGAAWPGRGGPGRGGPFPPFAGRGAGPPGPYPGMGMVPGAMGMMGPAPHMLAAAQVSAMAAAQMNHARMQQQHAAAMTAQAQAQMVMVQQQAAALAAQRQAAPAPHGMPMGGMGMAPHMAPLGGMGMQQHAPPPGYGAPQQWGAPQPQHQLPPARPLAPAGPGGGADPWAAYHAAQGAGAHAGAHAAAPPAGGPEHTAAWAAYYAQQAQQQGHAAAGAPAPGGPEHAAAWAAYYAQQAQQQGPAAAAAAAAQQQQAYGYAYAAQGDAAKRQRTG